MRKYNFIFSLFAGLLIFASCGVRAQDQTAANVDPCAGFAGQEQTACQNIMQDQDGSTGLTTTQNNFYQTYASPKQGMPNVSVSSAISSPFDARGMTPQQIMSQRSKDQSANQQDTQQDQDDQASQDDGQQKKDSHVNIYQ